MPRQTRAPTAVANSLWENEIPPPRRIPLDAHPSWPAGAATSALSAAAQTPQVLFAGHTCGGAGDPTLQRRRPVAVLTRRGALAAPLRGGLPERRTMPPGSSNGTGVDNTIVNPSRRRARRVIANRLLPHVPELIHGRLTLPE